MSSFFSVKRLFRSTLCIGLVIGLAILLRLLLIAASNQVPATSDEASVVLQAKEIARGDFPLLFLGQPLLFPVESYTMAPLVEWLPRTTAGARYQTWVLGSLSVFGFLLLARASLAKNRRWPTYLLILFPSSYLLLLTAGYAPPQYPTSLTLAWVSLLLVTRHRQCPRSSLLILSGATCGLAISNHLLFLPVAVAVLTMIVFNGNHHKGLAESLPFGLGLGLGLAPFLAAILFIPGAYPGFGPVQSLREILASLYHFVLSESLAGAMGMYPTLFPDLLEARMVWVREIRLIFAVGYVALCGYVLALRFSALLRNLREKTWPQLQLIDAALLISLLTIALFASHDNEYYAFRYLLHAVWCFPFLIGFAYAAVSSRTRRVIAAVVAGCVLFNIFCSVKMIRQWRKPGRISAHADLPPLDPLLQTLSSMKVEHCYASFWLAYRISFASNETIKCTGPYNERFVQWPIPYKKAVDEDERTVYALTVTPLAKLNAMEFENNLAMQAIGFERTIVGPYFLYRNFSRAHNQPERQLQPGEHFPCQEYRHGDHCTATAKNSGCCAAPDPSHPPLVEIGFPQPLDITGLQLNVNPLLADFERDLSISAHQQGVWRTLENGADYRFARLSFAHGHPIYHDNFHLLTFEKVTADALRLSLPSPPQQLLDKPPTFEVFVSP